MQSQSGPNFIVIPYIKNTLKGEMVNISWLNIVTNVLEIFVSEWFVSCISLDIFFNIKKGYFLIFTWNNSELNFTIWNFSVWDKLQIP